MKHIQFILTSVMALCLLAACSQDGDITEMDEAVAVEFNMAIASSNALRTSAGGEQWTAGDRIGIYMMPTGNGIAGSTAQNVAYQATTTAASSGFTPVDAGRAIYYPQSGNVDFVAYYPYGIPNANNNWDINLTGQTTEAGQSARDMLYAKTTNVSKGANPVGLQFNHVLSKVSINVKPGDGMTELPGSDITNANYRGMPSVASFNLQTGALTGKTINPFDALKSSTPSTGYVATFTAIVIPQEANEYGGRTLTFTVSGESYTWNIPDAAAFTANTHYTYEITINSTGLTASAGNITDWSGTTDSPITGEAGGWKVGDYYPNPANSATAIGIVFWIDPASSGKHGKIVGLDEKSNVKWADNNYREVQTNATDQGNGITNMKKINEYITANVLGWDSFPAFEWANTKNPANTDYSNATTTGVWYLPAIDELQYLFCTAVGQAPQTWEIGTMPPFNPSGASLDFSAFNNKLTAVGGTGLENTWYWSSSENTNERACYVSVGSGETATSAKSYYFRARAILAF